MPCSCWDFKMAVQVCTKTYVGWLSGELRDSSRSGCWCCQQGLASDWRALTGQPAAWVCRPALWDPSVEGTRVLSTTSVLAVFLDVAVWEKRRNCFAAQTLPKMGSYLWPKCGEASRASLCLYFGGIGVWGNTGASCIYLVPAAGLQTPVTWSHFFFPTNPSGSWITWGWGLEWSCGLLAGPVWVWAPRSRVWESERKAPRARVKLCLLTVSLSPPDLQGLGPQACLLDPQCIHCMDSAFQRAACVSNWAFTCHSVMQCLAPSRPVPGQLPACREATGPSLTCAVWHRTVGHPAQPGEEAADWGHPFRYKYTWKVSIREGENENHSLFTGRHLGVPLVGAVPGLLVLVSQRNRKNPGEKQLSMIKELEEWFMRKDEKDRIRITGCAG